MIAYVQSEAAKRILQLAEAYAQAANTPRRAQCFRALEKAVIDFDIALKARDTVLAEVQKVIPERIAANLDEERRLDRDRFKAALEAIVRGDYAPGAEIAHPAVGLARQTLTTP